MKKILISIGAIICLAAVVTLASSVFAQDNSLKVKFGFNASTTESTIASSTLKRAAKLDQTTANLQDRADKEIDRRIISLNRLLNKIQDIKKISSTFKTSLVLTVQGQITLLNNLKIKINADTDAATVKIDLQTISRAYRIYALILPQIEIIAGAEQLASTADSLSALANKLQTRITIAQTGGKDVTTLQTLLTDMNAKIADANLQSANAIVGVSALVPDNGDKTVMTNNTTALKAARTAINTGTKDLKDANKDGVKIRIGLKSFEKETATSTATTTPKSNKDNKID